MHTLQKRVYGMALCLSALAGCVDAIGFIHLSGFFVSFMSGNTTRLAVSLAQGDTGKILLLASILSLFVVGAMLGVLVRHFFKEPNAMLGVLLFVTALLTGAAIGYELNWQAASIAFMTLAMGAENAILQKNGDVLGLTYMTGTLVKVGQRLANSLLGGERLAWAPYLFLWLSLLSGGVTGALLFHYFGLRAIWFAVAWAAGITAMETVVKRMAGI